MSVIFFTSGVTVTDEMATRLDVMSVDIFLNLYRDAHDGADPPGWPAAAAHKALAEWGIKHLVRNRLEQWERKLGEAQVVVLPWAGGDVEGAGK